ncbi:MAG: nicotinate-nucleotide--dimethylbenzimidazole phosphoribosyltransferase [Chloroflexota bacterium]|jgi:nicotinate-nucleotide--dimethylbenzimidazole phosphoribosyltransferase|nr:nicotinate-nucleotide--dimethylbenzimidazole phosphoribosyltransferase [Chloroflexota bacterium]
MTDLGTTVARIPPASEEHRQRTQARLDFKTKPRGSLGRLEELACSIAAIQQTDSPRIGQPVIVVVAADHGVAAEGISAYPQEVTVQMLHNFVSGGAAINVLARCASARLIVVDAGVSADYANPAVLDRRIGPGTANAALGPAMSTEQARTGLGHGIELANMLAHEDAGVIGLGDMGIGNTTASSALVAAFLGLQPQEVTGRGTGLDDAGVARKAEVLGRMLAANNPDAARPLDTLAALGGFEHAVLAGIILGAAANRTPVILDGVIVSAAALVAARIAPASADAMIASHYLRSRRTAGFCSRWGFGHISISACGWGRGPAPPSACSWCGRPCPC